MGDAARVLGFEIPSDFARAYPVSKEWLTPLIRKMDAVAAIYCLAASVSPGSEDAFLSVADSAKGLPVFNSSAETRAERASWATHGFFRRHISSTGSRCLPWTRWQNDHFP